MCGFCKHLNECYRLAYCNVLTKTKVQLDVILTMHVSMKYL